MGKIYCFSINVTVILIILCGFYTQYTDGGWSSQCWKKHNSGSIQTPDGEFKRPFGILCTYQCFLWYPPVLIFIFNTYFY
uniref:Uncharacterized protein n=1 Tax=Glossina pallidipes TaxID=7398 RepID=A0A1B0A1B8_GLOPL